MMPAVKLIGMTVEMVETTTTTVIALNCLLISGR